MAIDYLENNVVDLFDAWAVDTPDAAAVEWNGESLSYAGLRNASLNVSKALLSVGAGAGDKIPILSQMSLEFLPAVLGILRVGACYIPVDLAAWSQDRIDSTLKDISPRVAIATQDPVNASGVPVILNFPKSWLSTQLDSADVVHSQLQTIRQSLDNQSLVYTTFTSGTTGKPKGVMIYHRALYKFATLRSGDALNTQSGERVLLAFSISFDGKL
jgi:non-ribosomal peptide synthetase component F